MSNKAHHSNGAAVSAAKTFNINSSTSAEAKEEIIRAAIAAQERVVAIEAAAGTGKSHLLRALASQPGVEICAHRLSIAHHVWSLTEPPPTGVVVTVGGLLVDGIEARTPDELISALRSKAGVKTIVVVEPVLIEASELEALAKLAKLILLP